MTTSGEAAAPETPDSDGWDWAVVEVFGHRRHAGRTREEERFGAKLLRIDIPVKGDPAANGWETIYYGGSSIFSFALCTEAAALKANKPWEPPSRVSPMMMLDHAEIRDAEEDFADD